MVLRKTQLAARWKAGECPVLELDEYVQWLADFVERLAPEQVLHRLTGDADEPELLAPLWSRAKNDVRAALERELERRNTRQGGLYMSRR
jgi:radical SAM superfamily enzyme